MKSRTCRLGAKLLRPSSCCSFPFIMFVKHTETGKISEALFHRRTPALKIWCGKTAKGKKHWCDYDDIWQLIPICPTGKCSTSPVQCAVKDNPERAAAMAAGFESRCKLSPAPGTTLSSATLWYNDSFCLFPAAVNQAHSQGPQTHLPSPIPALQAILSCTVAWSLDEGWE